MASTTVIRLLAEQRKRCNATIFRRLEESPWWGLLKPHEQNQLKDEIRESIAIYYDFTRDVVKVTEDDGVRNELALDLIRSIHHNQQALLERPS